MKLLVIGGSQFVGRHLVELAVRRGHQVTVFNRGQTTSATPEGVAHIQGDRKGDLTALTGQTWDAVVDTCGYLPADVTRMATILSQRVARYVFVSSISVYASFSEPNTERSARGLLPASVQSDTDVVDGDTYGPLKALCEDAVMAIMGAQRTLIVRPGLIVGPFDPTQRFTYWPARVARASDHEPVLAPGRVDHPTQFIDVRDLCHFVLDGLASDRSGCFNVASPPGQWSMGDLLETCATVAACRPRWVWVDGRMAERLKLQPWTDLPTWVPDDGSDAAFLKTNVSAALAAGLQIRPLIDTVTDTLNWWRSLCADAQSVRKAGLSPEREATALAELVALAGSAGLVKAT